MSVWPGDPPFSAETIATVAADGYYLRSLALGEHSGTHFGAPAHFHEGGLTADRFEAGELVRPAAVLHLRRECARDRDLLVRPEMIERWEATHGRVPEGSIVLVDTGWSELWSDAAAYSGRTDNGGTMHFPGISLEAARLLAEERGVIGLGIDTLGIDGGIDEHLSVNAYWLSGRRYHLENLASLDRLPATGATLVVGVLKIAESSGGPARVLAII
jgi:kynurenine formamidase